MTGRFRRAWRCLWAPSKPGPLTETWVEEPNWGWILARSLTLLLAPIVLTFLFFIVIPTLASDDETYSGGFGLLLSIPLGVGLAFASLIAGASAGKHRDS